MYHVDYVTGEIVMTQIQERLYIPNASNTDEHNTWQRIRFLTFVSYTVA